MHIAYSDFTLPSFVHWAYYLLKRLGINIGQSGFLGGFFLEITAEYSVEIFRGCGQHYAVTEKILILNSNVDITVFLTAAENIYFRMKTVAMLHFLKDYKCAMISAFVCLHLAK